MHIGGQIYVIVYMYIHSQIQTRAFEPDVIAGFHPGLYKPKGFRIACHSNSFAGVFYVCVYHARMHI